MLRKTNLDRTLPVSEREREREGGGEREREGEEMLAVVGGRRGDG